MSNFCKNEDCPPSQQLLAYQLGEIELSESRDIRRHLAACEFCAAEVEFYEHYPPAEEAADTTAAEMPEPLFELAEALLSGKRGVSSLEKLVRDVEDSGDDR